MKRIRWILAITAAAAWCLPCPQAAAVEPGQTDTFEDATTQGWYVGLPSPVPPDVIDTGGPAGAGDHYLSLSALGGNGPGSKLVVFNEAQWAGDYLAAGIPAITLDVNNLGSSELALRLLFADPTGGPPSDIAVSTQAVFVPAQSGWRSVAFPIATQDLTGLLGSVEAALSNTTDLRLFHSLELGFPGPGVVAQLGVDNIHAVAVPEPSSVLVLGMGLALWVVRRRGRRF